MNRLPLPIGIFSILDLSREPEQAKQALALLEGGLQDDVNKDLIVDYLRRGTPTLAIMQHTTDLLGAKFETPGGSAIVTDGYFFWRLDTADYVEHYRVALSDAFVLHGEECGWSATRLSEETIAELDAYLYEYYRASSDQTLWSST